MKQQSLRQTPYTKRGKDERDNPSSRFLDQPEKHCGEPLIMLFSYKQKAAGFYSRIGSRSRSGSWQTIRE